MGAVKIARLDLKQGDPMSIKVHLQNARKGEDEEYFVHLTLTAVNFGKKQKQPKKKGPKSPKKKDHGHANEGDKEEEVEEVDEGDSSNGAEITQEEADKFVKGPASTSSSAPSISSTNLKLAYYEIDLTSVTSVPRTMLDVKQLR